MGTRLEEFDEIETGEDDDKVSGLLLWLPMMISFLIA